MISVWAGGHAAGYSEAADIIAVLVGGFFLGWTAFEVGEDVYEGVKKATNATTVEELDSASKHFAKAVTTTAVMAGMIVGGKVAGDMVGSKKGSPSGPTDSAPKTRIPINQIPKDATVRPVPGGKYLEVVDAQGRVIGQTEPIQVSPKGNAPPDAGTAPSTQQPFRTDEFPHSPTKAKGGVRSYIDSEGNLRPANTEGTATIQQHIRGSDPAKADSPYTSFSEPSASAKPYGGHTIRLDKARLQADIASGKVRDVKIIEHNEVVSNLNGKINEAQAKVDANPTRNNLDRLDASKRDLANATRDREFLVQGVVPKDYITVEPVLPPSK